MMPARAFLEATLFRLLLSASEKKEIVFGDKNLNKSIRDIADAFSEMFKEDAKNVDPEMLEQIIKINLSKQEMIR